MILFVTRILQSRLRSRLAVLLVAVLFFAVNGYSQEWLYTVQPGDNLWDLSEKHLVSMQYWEELQALNKVEDPLAIKPGTTLRFPMAWLKSGSSVATIIHLFGRVEVVDREGQIKNGAKGMLLWDNDLIRTGEKSNVTIQFSDGSKILLQESSELKLENLMSYGDSAMSGTRVRLESGRTHNKVRPKTGPGSRFEISTPSAIAAVRGTEYRISADKNGESRAEVIHGEVGVDSSGQSKAVHEGFGVVSYTDRAPLEPVALLQEPDLSALPASITRVPFPVKFEPVAGAKAYRMQIAGDSSFDSLLFDTVFPSSNLWGPDLPNGEYYLRVHGIDENGLEGMDAVRSIRMDAHPIPPMLVQPAANAVVPELQPTFTWTEPQDISGYVFQLAHDEQFNDLLLDLHGLEKTALTPDRSLDPGVYHWRVATVDMSRRQGPYSDPQLFRRPVPGPDLSRSELDQKEMVFRWRRGDPGQKFRCQIAWDTDFAEIVADEEIAEPQFSLKEMPSGSYFIRVAVVDVDGYVGPFSPYQKTVVPSEPPPAWVYLLPFLGLLICL